MEGIELKKRRPQLRKRTVIMALAIFVLVATNLTALAMMQARTELLSAKASLVQARAQLIDGDVARARTSYRTALGKAHRADTLANNLAFKALGVVPILGAQLDQAGVLAAAGVQTVEAAGDLIDAAEASPGMLDRDALARNGTNIVPILEGIKPALPALGRATKRLEDAKARIDASGSGWLLGTLTAARADMSAQLDDALQQVRVARGMVGVGDRLAQSKPLRLLLLSQDTWELRPSGGYIGSYGILEIRKGRMHLLKYEDAVALPYPKTRLHPTYPLDSYLTHPWTLTGAGWWPDFPRSARAAQDLYLGQGGSKVDGVLAITQTFLEDLLEGLGPVKVPGYPDIITADNAAERILYNVELKRPADIPRKRFLTELTEVLFDRLERFDGSESRHVIEAIGRAFRARHAQIYFNEPALNEPFALAGWDGAMTPPPANSDYFSVADANFGADKANRWVRKSIDYRVFWNARGRPEAEVTIATTDFGVASPINPRYVSYLRAYTLPGARFYPATMVEKFTRIDREDAFQTLGLEQVIEAGATETRTFHYELPSSVVADGRYSLFVRPQAGTPADTYTIRIELGREAVTRTFSGDAGDQSVSSEAVPIAERAAWPVRFWRSWAGALRR